MLFKVALGKQIHIVNSKDKNSFADLKKTLPSVFKRLPERFTLSYIDEDSDEITLTNQNDFNILILSGMKTVKIFIKEQSEAFYDRTQEVLLEEDFQPQIIIEEPKALPIEEISFQESGSSLIQDSSIDVEKLNESIEDKLKVMLPSIIEKIKKEISEESRIKGSKISEAKEEVQGDNRVIHKFITCDGCGKKPIIGARYKCAVCADFDFCEECEATVEHPHPFLKIKTLKQTPHKIIVVTEDEHDSFEINGNSVPLPGFHHLIKDFAQQFMHDVSPSTKESFKKCKEEFKRNFKGCHGWKRHHDETTRVEKTETKVEQTEAKVEQKIEEPVVVSVKVQEKKPAEIDPQTVFADNANYLYEVLEKDYSKCLKFAKRHPGQTKEALLEAYFTNGKF